MKNTQSKKYILQETRELRKNEFVYRRSYKECACKDGRFWDHLRNIYSVNYENIDDTTLPDDANGERMWGIRVVKIKDWGANE